MGLRSRPRYRLLEQAAGLAWYHISGQAEADRRQSETLKSLDENLAQLGGYREGSPLHLMRERKRKQLVVTLNKCRVGMIDPWGAVLYARTLDVVPIVWPVSKRLMYGFHPAEINSTREEILGFWVQYEARQANTWIEQCKQGDFTNANKLLTLCLIRMEPDMRPDFFGLLDEPWEKVWEIIHRQHA